MKKILSFLLLAISLQSMAQQLPPYDRSRLNQVMTDRATQARYFMAIPFGTTPGFPAYVPDSLKVGALYMQVGTGNDGLKRYNGTSWVAIGPSMAGYAIDTTVVHKIGAETIAGTKTHIGIVNLNATTNFGPSGTVKFNNPLFRSKWLAINGLGNAVPAPYTPADSATTIKTTGSQQLNGTLNINNFGFPAIVTNGYISTTGGDFTVNGGSFLANNAAINSQYYIRNEATTYNDQSQGLRISEYPFSLGGLSFIHGKIYGNDAGGPSYRFLRQDDLIGASALQQKSYTAGNVNGAYHTLIDSANISISLPGNSGGVTVSNLSSGDYTQLIPNRFQVTNAANRQTAYKADGIEYANLNSGFKQYLNYTDATANRTITFPDKSGTISLTTDLPTGGVADDATVVHKAGAETIPGEKTFAGQTTLQGNTSIGAGTDKQALLTVNNNAGALIYPGVKPLAWFVGDQDKEAKLEIDGRNSIPSVIFARQGANGGAPKKDSIALQVQLATMTPAGTYSTTRTSVLRSKYTEDQTATGQGHDITLDNKQNGSTVNERRLVIDNNGFTALNAGSSPNNFRVVYPTRGVGQLTTVAGSATVTGKNTVFTESLKVTDPITIAGETHNVVAITNDSTLVTNVGWTNSNTKAPYTVTSKVLFIAHGHGGIQMPSYNIPGGVLYTTGSAGLISQTAAITGIMKGNGSAAPSAAVDGVDFLSPSKIVDSGPLVLTDSVAWTGTTAPSGTKTNTYQWTQVGKMVTLRVNLVYSSPGNSITEALINLPSSIPTPATAAGMIVTNNNYTGFGGLLTSMANPPTATARVGMKSSGGIYQVRIIQPTGNYAYAQATIIYNTL